MTSRHVLKSLQRLDHGRFWPRVCQKPGGRRSISTVGSIRPFRLAIIGSGPAGFYTAYRVMSRIEDAKVDMFEKLPVPFGLVRFGVAPDHPEVKNCQDKFTEVAESPRFNFVGNVEIGRDLALTELRPHYDAILFAYGASEDKELGLPGEHLGNIHSARAFVGWYNGLPEYADLSPKLDAGETAVVIGQGNVALDVARILLSGVDRLKSTDITEEALDVLSRSRIKRVHVVGRRGPMQASFTIKEVRELMQLSDVTFKPLPLGILPSKDVKLERPSRRIADLLIKSSTVAAPSDTEKQWSLDFMLSPTKFGGSERVSSVQFDMNAYTSVEDAYHRMARVRPTGEQMSISTEMVFRSIGYKSAPLPGMEDLGVLFDTRKGVVANEGGRVMSAQGPIPGLYCTGWVKNGPTGVIATTMEDAFASGEMIVKDWSSRSSQVHGWETLKSQMLNVVDWKGWTKIDAEEKRRGSVRNKEREKFTRIEQMLEAA